MSLDVLLVGPRGYGGEGTYIDTLRQKPPPGVRYDLSHGFHSDASGASCRHAAEAALNRALRPATVPDIGFRALRLTRRYDLIHSHAHPVLLSNARGVPLLMSESSSAMVYLADYLGWEPRRIQRAVARSRRAYRLLNIHDRLLNLDQAHSVYVYTNWARSINIKWGADPSKVKVIMPGVVSPPVIDRRARATFTFLFVGTDFERKGGYEVVEAFAQIAGDLPHTRLLIAGSDPNRPNPDLLTHSWVSSRRKATALEKLTALQATGRASRLAWVSPADLRARVFPAADAFVMPTHAEGFGFTNIEALSFQLPVITSTFGPMPELVRDGETGTLLRPGDVAALADAMSALASSPKLALKMGTAARRDFEYRFSLARFHHELRALYATVAGS